MSGKPQFDESTVIAAAVDVFWRRGYAAASISDLTDAMGLSRSSMYQRFGDKDSLFVEALQAYTERVLRRMNAAQGETAREQLAGVLRAFIPDPSAAQRPAGCLIARSCAETVELSLAGRDAAMAALASQREVLMGIMRKGIRNKELTRKADVESLAWHFLGVQQAVINFASAGADPGTLNRMIDAAMTAWPEEQEAASRR